MSRFPELDRMRLSHYQMGRHRVDTDPIAASLLRRLEEDCPHVERRDLVALLHLENQELVAATAHRWEYNATHPAGPEGR